MRRSLCLLFLLPVFVYAQRTYKPEEISRLADLGRLWGILHYFHPAMADGSILTESLVVDNAASLANDPSAENFKRVVGGMLGRLKDGHTRIYSAPDEAKTNLFADSDSIKIYRLSNGVLYIACPVSVMKKSNPFQRMELSVAELAKTKGVVFDIRAKSFNESSYDKQFVDSFAKKYLRCLLSNSELKSVYAAFIQHNGFISQTIRKGYIYSSGWRSESYNDIYESNCYEQALQVPIAFVVNNAFSDYLSGFLQSLQYTGKCAIVYEGDPLLYNNQLITPVSLSENMNVLVKTGYKIIGNNHLVPGPDKIVPEIKMTSEFQEECGNFLLSFDPSLTVKQPANMEYTYPRPAVSNTMFVGTGERLLGLYNYWNVINYFFPNKHLSGNVWGSILNQYIPIFIAAKDTFQYFEAIRSLTSEIHDSHANNVGPIKNRNVLLEKYYYMPAVLVRRIGDKIYIIDVQKNNPSKSQVQIWDEVIKVAGMPVMQYAQRFRKYFSASNETGYYRDVCSWYLLAGERNSDADFTVNRNGKIFDVTLKRTVELSTGLSDTLMNFSVKYPVAKILPEILAILI